MNRSYVYAFDRSADGRIVRVVALSESEANIPLIYRILVSVNPTAAKSIVFDSDEKIAITASYDMGLSRLSAFFIQLPEEYRERCDKLLSFLREEKNRRMYIHLECAEIYEMDDDTDDIAAKNAKLIEELSHIEDEMKKAIKRVVYDGDVFDVRELEAEYWSNTLALMPEMDDDDAEEERENPFFSDVFAKLRETKEKKENAGEDDDDEVSEVDKTGLFGDVFSAIREYEAEDADDVDDKKPWQSSAFMSERTQLRQFVQSHPESKKWKKFNATVNDPELYKQKDTGKDCGVFALKEGVITALPIEPKNMYSLNDDTEIEEWRLFLQDKEGKTRAVMEYYYALEMLKKLSANSRNFILGEKDMYLITSPLTAAEMDTLIRQSGASFSSPARRGAGGEVSDDGDEWVNNVEVVKTPYVEQLSEKKSLFTFIFLVMSFLNAALFSSGRINMGAFEQFSLFLRSVALSLALAAVSYAVGYAILSFISGRLRSKGRKLLSFIAVLCCIDLVLRVLLLAVLRDSVEYAATPTAFSFGTLFALFDVWQRHIDDEHIAPLGKIWRILAVFFAVLLLVCWHFFGIVIGSLIVAGVALVVFALICTANAISDALAKKFHAEKPIQRLQKNVASAAKSWKVRAVLIASVASFAFFVHWLDFKGGAIVWAVFAFLVGLLVYFLRGAFKVFGEIIGDKFSRDGVDVDIEDDEEMGGNMPEIIHIGALQTPCGVFSLTQGEAIALPMNPKSIFSLSDTTIYFWRLFVYDASGEQIADLDYERALWWLKATADEKAGEGVKELEDGFEYVVLHSLSAESLASIIDAVKADSETDDVNYLRLKGERSEDAEEEETAEEPSVNDDMSFETLGKEGVLCGVFHLFAGRTARFPVDPRALYRGEAQGGKASDCALWRMRLYDEEHFEIADLEFYHAMWWLKTRAPDGVIALDARENLIVGEPLTTEELLEMKETVEAGAGDEDAEYLRLKAEKKEKGTSFWELSAGTDKKMHGAVSAARASENVWEYEDEEEGEENSFEDGLSRKTVLSTAYISGVAFETVRLSGDEKHPKGVEMLKAVLTRAQSDCGGEYVFSESAQLGEDIDDDRYPIDSFNFYWAIQYCNALSLTCHLEPCYSIDGETYPDAWGIAPYREYNSFTKKWNENTENEAVFARVVCNFDANGWRLPTLEECRRAANTDGIEKETIYEIKQLWIWSDDVPRHSALVQSDWKSGELTAEAQEPQEVRPSYSIRICRNADIGSSLPLADSFGAERAESDARKTQDDEKAFDYFQGAAQTGKKSKGTWRSLLIPFSIVVGGLILFWLTGSIAVCYGVGVLLFLTRGFWSACDEKEEKKLRRESSSNEKNTPIREAVERITAGKKAEYTHEEAAAILEYLKKMYSMPAVRIRAEDRTGKPMLAMTASKFGGLPYWTRGEEYPTGENGEKLYLLAQINFADVPPLPDYPRSGLLQIFIANDDMYGWDAIEHGTKTPQKNWRVVWRDVVSPSLAMSAAELSAMGVRAAQKTGADGEEISLPIENEFGLTFEKIESHINPSCDGFGEAVKKAAVNLGLPVFAGWDYEWFSDVDYQEFYGDGRVAPHQIGGHPQFTQGEIRPDGDILLLFQMASEWIATGGDDDDDEMNAIMWGDMGIANFFLSREDLRARDFSRVLYNWDCY